ncbi:hypothetical protein BC936DRAFT_149392 [Jimgerdemannia flammicorona]|uniref:Uncharacterized protein n=1 Tax=Jimgerdemannia flammicorona TaxID=994334 RepID=A0A433D0W6_9FUNG|nr:hypothetical protein BC936DRAFT_149392 [Jimgerdemannia flammicorona]
MVRRKCRRECTHSEEVPAIDHRQRAFAPPFWTGNDDNAISSDIGILDTRTTPFQWTTTNSDDAQESTLELQVHAVDTRSPSSNSVITLAQSFHIGQGGYSDHQNKSADSYNTLAGSFRSPIQSVQNCHSERGGPGFHSPAFDADANLPLLSQHRQFGVGRVFSVRKPDDVIPEQAMNTYLDAQQSSAKQ